MELGLCETCGWVNCRSIVQNSKLYMVDVLVLGIMLLSLVIWLVLCLGWGQFWRVDVLEESERESELACWPSVCVTIPARNEAELLPRTLRSHLQQTYPGPLSIILVDDSSTDGTVQVAQQVAQEMGKSEQVQVVAAAPLPAGWTGKLWALHQGICRSQSLELQPDYLLLADADIEHDPDNLRRLVVKAETEELSLASVMVRLRCVGFWEQGLIPAFVFFFQKLYPFRWVNDVRKSTAAAAGGCILIRNSVLQEIGGIQVVRQALIDDCALAQAVKRSKAAELDRDVSDPLSETRTTKRRIWLGLSSKTCSLRPYSSLASIWDMVARTAFTQLNYSPMLLVGTLFGMGLVYLVPPVGAIWGVLSGHVAIAALGASTWLLMSALYWPLLRFYKGWPGLTFCLPAIALLYSLMTADSALRHWQGRGGAWKGRTYSG